jgi:hypothetical protein
MIDILYLLFGFLMISLFFRFAEFALFRLMRIIQGAVEAWQHIREIVRRLREN